MNASWSIFAEIADKMPTLPGWWLGWLMAAGVFSFLAAWACFVRRWVGLIPVALALAASLIFHRPDLEQATLDELGVGYLAQYYSAALLPTILSCLVWLFTAHFRWRSPSMERSDAG